MSERNEAPLPLTTEELKELADLETWIDDLFTWAGMRLPKDKRDAIVDKVLG